MYFTLILMPAILVVLAVEDESKDSVKVRVID